MREFKILNQLLFELLKNSLVPCLLAYLSLTNFNFSHSVKVLSQKNHSRLGFGDNKCFTINYYITLINRKNSQKKLNQASWYWMKECWCSYGYAYDILIMESNELLPDYSWYVVITIFFLWNGIYNYLNLPIVPTFNLHNIVKAGSSIVKPPTAFCIIFLLELSACLVSF